jgi:cytochrome P450
MAEFLAPVLKARNDTFDAHIKGAERPEDAINWLTEEHRARGHKLTPDTLAQNIIITMFASIHSTSSIGLSTLFNLIDHPEYLIEIKEEILRVQQKHFRNSPFWTRQALAELRVLDSVMRETLRINSFNECTVGGHKSMRLGCFTLKQLYFIN